MRVVSLQFRAAAWSFFFVSLGAIAVRAASSGGLGFRALVVDAGAVAFAAMAIFLAGAALLVVVGGRATLDRLVAWGAANPPVGAARVVAAGVSFVAGVAIAMVASAHFLSHYRAAGWAALANGAVFAGGLVVGTALFVPTERMMARVTRGRAVGFRSVLGWTTVVVAMACAVVVDRIVPGSFAIAAPVVLLQAATLRWPPQVPSAIIFVVTRAFVVGCFLLLYSRLFGVPDNNVNSPPPVGAEETARTGVDYNGGR